MIEFLQNHQLNIMLILGSVCLMASFFAFVTRSQTNERRYALAILELSSAILLFADRLAYIYRGDESELGFYMVRICNFLVFAMILLMLFSFGVYLADLFLTEAKLKKEPKRLRTAYVMIVAGLILLVISQFTGLYYTFDEHNRYVRAPGYLICYVIPIFVTLLYMSLMIENYKKISRGLRIALLLFTVIPVIASVLQFFAYGVSMTNLAMVEMSVLLYIVALLDVNHKMEESRQLELERLHEKQESMKRLFDQTATAFVTAAEKKDADDVGHSLRVAKLARRIAKEAGMDEDGCDSVYYAGLLHDVGKLELPDELLMKDRLSKEEEELLRQKPILSAEILSQIREYPFLSEGARYCCESYDGSGYPDGLQGDKIPEIARIVAVAKAYDEMTTPGRYRGALPAPIVRENFIKEGGSRFDPEYANIMLQILDENAKAHAEEEEIAVEEEITCGSYRVTSSVGIPINEHVTKIRFRCDSVDKEESDFSAPNIILFDAYDRRIHDNDRAMDAYSYLEYAELWFDGHSISTAARNIVMNQSTAEEKTDSNAYEIVAGRYGDHMKVRMIHDDSEAEFIVALPDATKYSFASLTGENCHIYDITFSETEQIVEENDIPRIANQVRYTNRMESDVPNIQIDRTRSAATKGIELKDRLRLNFHTMSLPSASLVWHCPYVVLFYSEDKKVGGRGYREYAVIKLNGETDGSKEFSENRFRMKKDGFAGWEAWKEANKEGMECEVEFVRRGNRVVMTTNCFGISTENISQIAEGPHEVYVALTGDQVALTDIRVR